MLRNVQVHSLKSSQVAWSLVASNVSGSQTLELAQRFRGNSFKRKWVPDSDGLREEWVPIALYIYSWLAVGIAMATRGSGSRLCDPMEVGTGKLTKLLRILHNIVTWDSMRLFSRGSQPIDLTRAVMLVVSL